MSPLRKTDFRRASHDGKPVRTALHGNICLLRHVFGNHYSSAAVVVPFYYFPCGLLQYSLAGCHASAGLPDFSPAFCFLRLSFGRGCPDGLPDSPRQQRGPAKRILPAAKKGGAGTGRRQAFRPGGSAVRLATFTLDLLPVGRSCASGAGGAACDWQNGQPRDLALPVPLRPFHCRKPCERLSVATGERPGAVPLIICKHS